MLTAEWRPDGPPVTLRGLNALPLDLLVRWVAALAAMKVTKGAGVVSWLSRRTVTSGRKVKQSKPAIARELSISPSYVGALLAEARQQGIFGPTTPAGAGESPRCLTRS